MSLQKREHVHYSHAGEHNVRSFYPRVELDACAFQSDSVARLCSVHCHPSIPTSCVCRVEHGAEPKDSWNQDQRGLVVIKGRVCKI